MKIELKNYRTLTTLGRLPMGATFLLATDNGTINPEPEVFIVPGGRFTEHSMADGRSIVSLMDGSVYQRPNTQCVAIVNCTLTEE